MARQEYIGSGILEAFVLQALSEREHTEVSQTISQDAALQQEVRAIEEALFRYSALYSVNPPSLIKSSIESLVMSSNPNAGGSRDASTGPVTISLVPERRLATISWSNAAGVALLVASMGINYFFWNQHAHERQERAMLVQQMNKLKDDQKVLADELGDYRSKTAMMADTAIETVVMHTVVTGHPMAATLYWSKSNGDAYVAMEALPKPPAGMQYQLWVIQKGKPVSMGTLPNDMANSPVMQKVNMQVNNADAFAISLERRGGNPSPTTVFVMGKV